MRKILILGLIFSALWQCRGPEGLQTNNLSYLYNKQEVGLRPKFYIVPISDTLFQVDYKLETGDFLFSRPTDNSEYEARIQIEYRLLPTLESTSVLDSGIIQLDHRVSKVQNEILNGQFNLKMPNDLPQVLLYIKVSDRNRGSSQANFIKIDNSSYNASSYFLLKDSTGRQLFKNHIPPGLAFQVEHSLLPNSKLYVSHYRRDFPFALPPYSTKEEEAFDIDPDTTFLVPAGENIKLSEPGFYHFRLDTSQWKGFSIASYYPSFPLVGDHVKMAEPLRYLTTQKEYEEMKALMDKPEELKKWIDDFWIRRGGSSERARNLVANYYQRVEAANRNFSSYLEGWKTDRGIVYIIYGPPNAVYRSSSGEAWVYGNESSALSYYFNFIHLENPFTDNDYSLDRSSEYRYGWGQAVEAWRRGHIYNSKDIRREQDNYDQLQYRSRTPMWY
ncbi:MAG: GWxTD domain-containing protein [Bacteroidetes bacterium]|nr:GWxTD domain-containing protein [Bacteroidota bacterium]